MSPEAKARKTWPGRNWLSEMILRHLQHSADPAYRGRKWLFGTILLLVPVMAVLFLGVSASALGFGEISFGSQAFFPLKDMKKAPGTAKSSTNADEIPVVQLDVWENTNVIVSSPSGGRTGS